MKHSGRETRQYLSVGSAPSRVRRCHADRFCTKESLRMITVRRSVLAIIVGRIPIDLEDCLLYIYLSLADVMHQEAHRAKTAPEREL